MDVDREAQAYERFTGRPMPVKTDSAQIVVPVSVPTQKLNGGDPGETVTLLQGSKLTPENVSWLWNGFLARGKLHIVAGAPGTGKTTLALALAATVTMGGRWPDGTRAEVGNVLIWSAEDDVNDTLLPRLLAMGADSARVYFVSDVRVDGQSRNFDPSRDMAALELAATGIGDVRLIIVDPVVSAVAGDSHKNTETRRSLQPVVDLGSRLDAAVFGVTHFSKGTANKDPVERVTGSIAFGALPRVIFAAAKTTDEGAIEERIFVRAKSNNGPDGGGFGYDLQQIELPNHPGIFASRVMWGGVLEGTAQTLLAEVEVTEESGDSGEIDGAVEWLKGALENGSMEAREVFKIGSGQGYQQRTLQRARQKIGAKTRREGFGKGSKVVWYTIDDKNPIHDTTQSVSPMENVSSMEGATGPKVLVEDKDASQKEASTLANHYHLSVERPSRKAPY